MIFLWHLFFHLAHVALGMLRILGHNSKVDVQRIFVSVRVPNTSYCSSVILHINEILFMCRRACFGAIYG
jgi:hypothetical protein